MNMARNALWKSKTHLEDIPLISFSYISGSNPVRAFG